MTNKTTNAVITEDILVKISRELTQLPLKQKIKTTLINIQSEIYSILFNISRARKKKSVMTSSEFLKYITKELNDNNPLYINKTLLKKIKQNIKYCQISPFSIALFEEKHLNEFKRLAKTILFLIHKLVTHQTYKDEEILEIVLSGYDLSSFKERLYILGTCILSRKGADNLAKQQRKGIKTTEIYEQQRDIARQTYAKFALVQPMLVEQYQINPRKNTPKTTLKKLLEHELPQLGERTCSDWAKKLLETNGTL